MRPGWSMPRATNSATSASPRPCATTHGSAACWRMMAPGTANRSFPHDGCSRRRPCARKTPISCRARRCATSATAICSGCCPATAGSSRWSALSASGSSSIPPRSSSWCRPPSTNPTPARGNSGGRSSRNSAKVRRMSKTIFTACLGTETNTFASIPTGHQLFEETCLFRKGSYGKDFPMFGAPLAVWRQRSEAKGWTVVESLCAFAMPAGKTVKKVYEAFRDEIVADLKAAMPVDAVFLSCHGAMVAEGYDDCESDLLAHVRQVVGRDIPVGVELDLHCNVGAGTMRDATALVLFKEYPHVDVSERAEDLFNVMEGAIEGRTRPVMATFDCRMIRVSQRTSQPMRRLVDKLQSMEGTDGVLSLSIAHGFPWSDIREMSSRIIAITDNDKPKAEKLAKELGLEFFAMRDKTQPPYVTLDAAMARVSSHNLPKPMVLADVSDNAGGGAASDSTFILQALLDRKVQDAAIAMFWDPGAVKLAFEVGEGAELDIRLGGKLGPQSGPPIDARAKVLALGREITIKFGGNRKGVNTIGDAAALQIEGVTVIVNTKRSQCHSLDCFTKLGIDPSTKKVVVVKSMQHFHAAYAPIASEVVYVAAPGALVPDWSLLPYTKADKTQWPFVANPHGTNPHA